MIYLIYRILLCEALITKIENLLHFKERFTDRLLTGCITIIDSYFNKLNLDISNLYCEDLLISSDRQSRKVEN